MTSGILAKRRAQCFQTPKKYDFLTASDNYFALRTVFENHLKCRIKLSTNICPIKTDLSGNTV